MDIQNIVHRVFTIREMREWLIDNKQNGLSTYAITSSRAYALINNPCAKETDPAIVVSFDNNRPIGYSAVFAEEYISGNMQGRYFWGTTEWIEPEYRGKGIASKMMRTLKETTGFDVYMGLDSSKESIHLDKKQGAGIVFCERNRFELLSDKSLKARLLSRYITWNNKRCLKRISLFEYTNEYVNFIDERTYRFIQEHSKQDLFVRQREMMNWILHYPFILSIGKDVKANKGECEFGKAMDKNEMIAVKVWAGKELAGLYIINRTKDVNTLCYLYYDNAHRNEVFSSATLNLFKHDVERILFMSNEMLKFIHSQGIKHLNRKAFKDHVALTLPVGISVNESLLIQGGDGDMFC